MKNNVVSAFIYTLIASLLPAIIVRELLGGIPYWVPFTQFVILIGASIYLGFIKKRKQLSRYTAMLTAILVLQLFLFPLEPFPLPFLL